MKTANILLTLTAGIAGVTALAAPAFTFKEYNALPPERLHVPATPDSIQKENPFKTEDLLNSRSVLPDPANAGWTTMVTDTAGRLVLASPKDVPELRTFTTRMRADRFAKGRLVLNSTARAAVKVNGETKITKAASDSLPADAEAQIELLPMQNYEITVDILGMPDDKSSPDFKLEFVPADDFKDVAVTSAPGQKKRVMLSTVLQGERGSRISLSDNGKYLLYSTREVISDKETKRRASLIDAVRDRKSVV